MFTIKLSLYILCCMCDTFEIMSDRVNPFSVLVSNILSFESLFTVNGEQTCKPNIAFLVKNRIFHYRETLNIS